MPPTWSGCSIPVLDTQYSIVPLKWLIIFERKKAMHAFWVIILSNHFTGIFFLAERAIISGNHYSGKFFSTPKGKVNHFSENVFFHRWKRNVSFLWSSTLLLLHRFLKLRAKGWRPQRLRCVVTYPAALIPRTLCEWWAKPFAVIWSHFLCLELSNPGSYELGLLPLIVDPGVPLGRSG